MYQPKAWTSNRSTKFDVLVRVHNFVVLRENVQKNEKSVRPTIVKWMSDHMYRPPVNNPQTTVNKPQTFANAFKRSLQANAIKRTPSIDQRSLMFQSGCTTLSCSGKMFKKMKKASTCSVRMYRPHVPSACMYRNLSHFASTHRASCLDQINEV